jgi:hypothetical protein
MRPIDIATQTGTKDLQTVSITVRVLQQPISQFLPQIHQLLGREYDKKIFLSIGQEVLRTVVAQCIAYNYTQMMPTNCSSSEKTLVKKLKLL